MRRPPVAAYLEDNLKRAARARVIGLVKLGYPCVNLTLENGGIKTFRLQSFSANRLTETVEANLRNLLDVLRFNVEHGLLFFRLSSQLIPFASHPIAHYPWQKWFEWRFEDIGAYVREHGVRLSMHPDQYTVINSPDEKVVEASIRELQYHCELLDLLGVDGTHKVQIHGGGFYGDKERSLERFIHRYGRLSERVRRRLVIENDDRLFSFADCERIHAATGVPVLYDVFHHRLLNDGNGDAVDGLRRAARTWKQEDGLPMVDYSSQEPGKRVGTHVSTIDVEDFSRFLAATRNLDFDVMLEIKDTDLSAIKALPLLIELRPRV
ncbi:MAG: UV DNA damage repair endonuclease UvsE [Bryobacteraceae bacterium]|nr:UV DNA damage repair endonuclease UvsE [Bryobacteraceae bacterium]